MEFFMLIHRPGHPSALLCQEFIKTAVRNNRNNLATEVISNLSSDEVFTPPPVANAVLDLLPEDVWSDPSLRWLDPGAKTGVFLREAARRLVNAEYKSNDCASVEDFREILARKDIDAVVISTPDHWHVPMSLLALAADKDVFSEKPTHTIAEGRELRAAVKQRQAILLKRGVVIVVNVV